MKKEDFYKTFWDASEWTEEQKIKWQQKCFELGFTWSGSSVGINHLYADTYFLEKTDRISYSANYFRTGDCPIEKHYEDMFPDQPEDKLDVVAEIVKMVNEAQGIEGVEEEEEEDTFEGLVYVTPENDCEILVSSLSSEQKEFLSGNLVWGDLDRPTDCEYPAMNYALDSKNWVMSYEGDEGILKTSFNNIFQYKET